MLRRQLWWLGNVCSGCQQNIMQILFWYAFNRYRRKEIPLFNFLHKRTHDHDVYLYILFETLLMFILAWTHCKNKYFILFKAWHVNLSVAIVLARSSTFGADQVIVSNGQASHCRSTFYFAHESILGAPINHIFHDTTKWTSPIYGPQNICRLGTVAW